MPKSNATGQLELDVFSRVKLHYYDYCYATKALETVAKDRDLLAQFVKIAEARYSVGRGIQQDILRAQLELTLLRDREEGFQQQRDGAIAAINTLLDRSPEESLAPPRNWSRLPFPRRSPSFIRILNSIRRSCEPRSMR